MLIDHCRRLRAAVAVGAVEIESGDAMLAHGALKRGAAIDRLGCVVSQAPSVVLLPVWRRGQWVCNLRAALLAVGIAKNR